MDRLSAAQWSTPRIHLLTAAGLQAGDVIYRYKQGEPCVYGTINTIVLQADGSYLVSYRDRESEIIGKHRSEWVER